MKNTLSKCGIAVLFLAGLVMWGCSDSSNNMVGPSDSLTSPQRDALAEDFSSTMAAPDEGMLPAWIQMDASGGGLSSPGPQGSLDDTLTFTWNGFTVRRVRNFFDSTGAMSPTYDSTTSVRMDRLLWITGTHTSVSGRRTVTIDHFDSLMVTGIQPSSDVFTLNGDGTRSVQSHFTSRFDQNTKDVNADYAWTVTNVEISRNLMAHPYPLSGSIAVQATVHATQQNPGRLFDRTVHVSFTVTFDGTQFAELVFADGTHYFINLGDGECDHTRP